MHQMVILILLLLLLHGKTFIFYFFFVKLQHCSCYAVFNEDAFFERDTKLGQVFLLFLLLVKKVAYILPSQLFEPFLILNQISGVNSKLLFHLVKSVLDRATVPLNVYGLLFYFI